MTAYTPTYLLPYQVGTDAPCDAPDVWCALATLEDTTMKRIRDIRDRVSPAVPAAEFTTDSALVFAAGSALLGGGTQSLFEVPIEVVEVDTDGMIDTDRSLARIYLRRSGVYYLMGWTQFLGGGTAGGQTYTFYLSRDNFGVGIPIAGGGFDTSTSNWGNDDMVTPGLLFLTSNLRGSAMVESNPPTFPEMSLGIGLRLGLLSTEPLTLGPGRVAAIWLRDLP